MNSVQWDTMQAAREALDRLKGDRKVVDVIYAVNATRRRAKTAP